MFERIDAAYRPTLSDRAIGWVSPRRALERMRYRQIMQFSQASGVRSRLDSSPPATRDYRKSEWSLDSRRERAGQLDDCNAIAHGLIDRCVDNVIGQGIRPQATTDDDGWNEAAEKLFDDWAMNAVDVRRMGDLYSHVQPMLFRTFLIGGDVGAILLRDGSIQMIDPTDIATPIGKTGDTSIVNGVQLDRVGRPVGYYVADQDNANSMPKHTFVPENDFVFLTGTRRIRQTRGEPVFGRRAQLFDQIDGLVESVIAACQMAANLGLFIKQADFGSTLSAQPTIANAQGNQQRAFEMEPGMVKFGSPGESIEQIVPQQPQQNLTEFLAMVLRVLGLPLGMPLELILLDFSRTNYSSARASLKQAQITFTRMQQRFRNVVLHRLWRWRISKFIKSGELPVRDDAWSHRWIAPGWQWVDPLKEGESQLLAVDAGFETLTEVAATMGRDFGEIVAQRKREIQMMRDADLPIVHSRLTRDEGMESDAVQNEENETEEAVR